MALVHETLYQSENLAQVDFAEYVQKLTTHLFRSHAANPEAITLRVNADDVLLDIDAVVPCSLIINELISNALKYAFPAGQEGEIYIDLHPDNDYQLILTVSDNGVGLSPDMELHQVESLGLQLVTMLVEQLEGSIELDRSNGTAFKIVFSQ